MDDDHQSEVSLSDFYQHYLSPKPVSRATQLQKPQVKMLQSTLGIIIKKQKKLANGVSAEYIDDSALELKGGLGYDQFDDYENTIEGSNTVEQTREIQRKESKDSFLSIESLSNLNTLKRSRVLKTPIGAGGNHPKRKLSGDQTSGKDKIRRKSCYCSECGGQSKLEQKTMHIYWEPPKQLKASPSSSETLELKKRYQNLNQNLKNQISNFRKGFAKRGSARNLIQNQSLKSDHQPRYSVQKSMGLQHKDTFDKNHLQAIGQTLLQPFKMESLSKFNKDNQDKHDDIVSSMNSQSSHDLQRSSTNTGMKYQSSKFGLRKLSTNEVESATLQNKKASKDIALTRTEDQRESINFRDLKDDDFQQEELNRRDSSPFHKSGMDDISVIEPDSQCENGREPIQKRQTQIDPETPKIILKDEIIQKKHMTLKVVKRVSSKLRLLESPSGSDEKSPSGSKFEELNQENKLETKGSGVITNLDFTDPENKSKEKKPKLTLIGMETTPKKELAKIIYQSQPRNGAVTTTNFKRRSEQQPTTIVTFSKLADRQSRLASIPLLYPNQKFEEKDIQSYFGMSPKKSSENNLDPASAFASPKGSQRNILAEFKMGSQSSGMKSPKQSPGGPPGSQNNITATPKDSVKLHSSGLDKNTKKFLKDNFQKFALPGRQKLHELIIKDMLKPPKKTKKVKKKSVMSQSTTITNSHSKKMSLTSPKQINGTYIHPPNYDSIPRTGNNSKLSSGRASLIGSQSYKLLTPSTQNGARSKLTTPSAPKGLMGGHRRHGSLPELITSPKAEPTLQQSSSQKKIVLNSLKLK